MKKNKKGIIIVSLVCALTLLCSMTALADATSFEYKLSPKGVVVDSTGYIRKGSSGNAQVIVDTVQPSNNGSLDGVLYANVRNSNNNRCGNAVSFTTSGVYSISYWSGNGLVDNSYKLTMQTESTSSVGATVTGVFTP